MRDEKGNDHARIQGQGQGQEPMKSEIRPFWTISKLSATPFIMGADKWPRILTLGVNI